MDDDKVKKECETALALDVQETCGAQHRLHVSHASNETNPNFHDSPAECAPVVDANDIDEISSLFPNDSNGSGIDSPSFRSEFSYDWSEDEIGVQEYRNEHDISDISFSGCDFFCRSLLRPF
jgi:hypothetical protein